MIRTVLLGRFAAASCLSAFAALAAAQEIGTGGSIVTGGAGPNGAVNASSKLEHCDAPKGTLAIVEPEYVTLSSLSRYGLGTPSGLIRLMVQQSNCFQVVERGAGLHNLKQERALAEAGELQSGTNIGKGQMVGADFIVTPNVVFAENNAGGAGGSLLGALGGRTGAVLGGIAGGVKFKQAQTSLLLVDARSGLQIAAAEGSAQKTDFAIGATLFGRGAGAALGGYENTNEGKMVAASFLDNWNNIVRNVRGNASLIQAKAGPASKLNAAASVQAGAAQEGDVLVPKIAGARVLKSPQDGAAELMTLAKTDEVLAHGDEQNGYIKVTAPRGDGWVKKILLRKQ